MQITQLSQVLRQLEETSSRNQITSILAKLFKTTTPKDIDKVCYLVLGRLAPAYEGIEFNLAEKMLVKILAQAFSQKPEDIRKKYHQVGDLGSVAASLTTHKHSRLTVAQVYDRLMQIALKQGTGSQDQKITQFAALLDDLDSLSVRYITRIPLGKLRLGFSDVTLLDALSVMLVGDKSKRKDIEAAYNVTADIGQIAKQVKAAGLSGIKHITASPGTPIRTSLAERLPTADKIIEKVGPQVAVEPKMDGLRTQLHIYKETGAKKVAIFSRNLENITHMFPDVVKEAQKLKVKTVIFDAEAVGFNPKTGKFIPFQETIQRKRKYEIETLATHIPLKVFVFDLLYLNGQPVMSQPFSTRRQKLEKLFKSHKGNINLIPQKVIATREEFLDEFQAAVKEGLEGVMAKKLDVPYQAGGRGFHWVKYKPTTEKLEKGRKSHVLDTIDCLVMGHYAGRGKRASFGIGGFLAGIYHPQKDQYLTLTKVGTGLTDTQWREMKTRADKLKIKDKPAQYQVSKHLAPHTWIKPSLVVELKADQITKSPIHTAGLALRFPRLVRFRPDKDPNQVTSLKEVTQLFHQQ